MGAQGSVVRPGSGRLYGRRTCVTSDLYSSTPRGLQCVLGVDTQGSLVPPRSGRLCGRRACVTNHLHSDAQGPKTGRLYTTKSRSDEPATSDPRGRRSPTVHRYPPSVGAHKGHTTRLPTRRETGVGRPGPATERDS